MRNLYISVNKKPYLQKIKLIPLIILLLFFPSSVSCTSLKYNKETMSQVKTLFASGHGFMEKGQYAEAIKDYTKLLNLTQESNDNLNYSFALSFIGSAYYHLKDYKKAIEYKKQSVKFFKKEGAESSMASAYTFIGLSYEYLNKYQKAIDFVLLEIGIYKKLGNKSSMASSYMFIARMYFSLMKYEKSLEFKKNALLIYEELGEDLKLASTYDSIGTDFSDLNKKDKALENINKAMKIYKDVGREDKLAESLVSLGTFYRKFGKLDLAIENYQQSLRLQRKFKNFKSIALTLQDMGVTYLNKGDTGKALDFYEKAQKIYKDQSDESGYMEALKDIANVYSQIGQYGKAIEIFKSYLEYSKKEKYDFGIYSSYLEIGDIYSNWTRYDTALNYYEQALEINERFDPHSREANHGTVFVAMGYDYLHLGKIDKALEYLSSALEISKKSGDKGNVANILRAISSIQGVKQGYGAKIELLEQSLEIYKEIGMEHAVARNLLDLGGAYLRMEKNDKARVYLYQSLSIAQNIEHAEIWGDLNETIAALLLKEKKYGEAGKFLLEALKSVESLRTTATGAIRRDILASRIALYKYLAFTYLLTGDFSQSFSAIEKSRSRLLIDKLLNDSEELKVSQVNQIQKQLDLDSVILAFGRLDPRGNTSEILIEYAITKDSYEGYFKSTEVLLSHIKNNRSVFSEWPDNQREIKSAKFFDGEKQENYLEDIIRYYRFLLASQSDENNIAIKKIGRELYALLIKPLLPKLRGKKNLLIIPDGILNFLPFETLIDEEGRYLIEEFDVSYAQSISVLNLLKQRKYGEERKPMLAFGGATYDPIISEHKIVETDIQLSALTSNTLTSLSHNNTRSASEALARLGYSSWSNLPGSRLEVEAISAIVNNSKTVVGNDVSEANVKEMSANGELSQYKVIHFATHGMTVPEFPELSSIILSQLKDGQGSEDGYLRMEEISKLKLNADFVNLSACQTGLGKLYAGEGVVGLTHAFLTAGANGLSVSLWNVADESTAMFMVGVYQLVEQKGMSYSQAINEMKRAFIKGQVSMDTFEPKRGITVVSLDKAKPGKLSHPFYWAPFVYYGKN
jgi:CHAT domain-containing protein/tetratricopeptide (TPR) repeat protein